MLNFAFSRRFLPLFCTQFLGAFNDNFMKIALLMMVAFQLQVDLDEITGTSLIAAALFIAPYFLFSALAGQLADKYDRAPYCRYVKLAELILMAGTFFAFFYGEVNLLLALLFFMGAQSTFFSPAKYSLLPTHLKVNELLAGNALIEGGTYIAIITGLIGGSFLISLEQGRMWVGAVLVIFAVLGYLASFFIPTAPPPEGDAVNKIDWNIFRQTFLILRDAVWRQKTVRQCVLFVSIFWLAGCLYTTLLPALSKSMFGENPHICTLFYLLFALGIAAGSLLANRIFKGEIKWSYFLAAGAAGMALFTFDLGLSHWHSIDRSGQFIALAQLINEKLFWRVSADLFLISLCGGFWAVPLQSMMQLRSRRNVLARVIAGNNIVNSIYMAIGSLLTLGLIQVGMKLSEAFFLIGSIIMGVAIAIASVVTKKNPI